MEDKKTQSLENSLKVLSLQNKQQIASQHLQRYLQFFELQHSTLKPALPPLSSRKIIYYPHEFSADLQVRIKDFGKDYKIVFLILKYGYFQLEVSLLNIAQQSLTYLLAQKSTITNQSVIFFLTHNHQKYVVKRFALNKHVKQNFSNILREYFLHKVASYLGVAAKVQNYFGFDLFFYENCIQFFIEQCQPSVNRLQQLDSLRIKSLKDKLLLMHSLKIIHLDVKPINILYSAKKGEFLFIDFGFAKCIQQDLGFKTKTEYIGTYNYSSNDMRKLFDNGTNYVDLYYNDIHGLKLSIAEFQSQRKKRTSLTQVIYEDHSDSLQISRPNFQDCPTMEANPHLLTILHNKLELAKLKYFIFIDYQPILLQKTARSQLMKNVQDILQYLWQQNFNKTAQIAYSFIVKQSLQARKCYHSDFNIQQKRQSQLFHDKNLHDLSKNQFFKKIGINQKAQSYILSGKDPKVKLVLKQRQLQLLLDDKRLQRLPKYKYYSLFCQLIDFQVFNATIEQKRRVSQKLIERQKIAKNSFQIRSQFYELQTCLKHIFKYFIETTDKHFQKLIPLILINLIIINAFSREQALSSVETALRLPYSPANSAELVFRLHFVVIWLKEKKQIYEKRIQIDKIFSFLQKIIRNAYIQQQEQLLKVVRKLISFMNQQIRLQLNAFFHKNNSLDDQFLKQMKVCLILNRINLSFSESMNILYEISQIDRRVLFGQKLTHNHLKVLAIASTAPIQSILTHIYKYFKRNLAGTNLLKTFKIYNLFHIMNSQDQTLKQQIDQVHSNCLNIKQYKYRFDTLAHIQKVVVTNCQQKDSNLSDKMKEIFTPQYLNEFLSTFSYEFAEQFLLYSLKIVRTYYTIYNKRSQQIECVKEFRNKVVQWIGQLSWGKRKKICLLLLGGIEWIIVKAEQDRSLCFQLYFKLIKVVESLIQEKNYFNNLQEIFAYNLTKDAVRIVHQMFSQGSYEIKFEQCLTFISQTIKKFKLHLSRFAHECQCNQIYNFQSSYLLYKQKQTLLFLQFHNELLYFICDFPDKNYILTYESTLLRFVENRQQWWYSNIQVLFNHILQQARLKENTLAGLFLAITIHFCKPQFYHLDRIKFLLLKNVDFIAKKAKVVILKHFYSYYLFRKGTIKNKREKRFLALRFIHYAERKEITDEKVSNMLRLSKLCKKKQGNLNNLKIVIYGQRFFRNLVS